jgi:hypothetical protein
MISKKNLPFIGAKFYKYKEDGSLEIIRISRVKSEGVYVVHKDNDNKVTYIRTEEQLHEYTLLRSDAIYTFSIVVNAESNEKLYDVIVTMARKSDKGNKPYVVCRQMMQNIFAQMVTTQKVLGMSLSQDTCPADVKFEVMLMCSKLINTIIVNGYVDDTPETILKFAQKIIKQADKILSVQASKLSDAFQGLCGSVEELLKENGFWDDVDKGLKITKLNDKIENCSLNTEQLTYLESEISYLMDNVTVVEYDKDIDFSKIKTDYMLIRDNENKIYLVNYIRGTFIQQKHLSEEEVKKFTSIKI